MTYVVSQLVDHVFAQLCAKIDTPRSLAAWLLYSHGEHAQLVQLDCKPSDYLELYDVNKFRDDYLITEYLSKARFLKTGIDTESVASASFIAAELSCASANQRIRAFTNRGMNPPSLVGRAIQLASEKIQNCLGSRVPWRRIIDKFKWGKGATFSLKGEEVCLDTKLLEEQISVTQEALPLLRAAMATDYAWLRARGVNADGPVSLLSDSFQIVRGSRGLLVEKNAKTKRFIAAEPSGNIFLQLGFGAEIRRCLHRVGIDLDRQEVNQDLAKRALSLGLATVDLKQASDTICRELVWLLLPHQWSCVLDDLRSHELLFDGRWHMLSKFSSMGNGFTFELETLIFWALTEALRDLMSLRGRVSVYGDDIICPSQMFPQLQELLSWVGFTTNVKKSHADGVFRESCGVHFYGGCDVTPIYQKDFPTGQERYRMVNRLLYHAIDRGYSGGVALLADRKLRFVTRLPSLLHGRRSYCRIPIQRDVDRRSLDGGYAVGFNPAIFRYRDGSFVSRSWRFIPQDFDADHGAIFAARLRKGASSVHEPDVVLPIYRWGRLRIRNYLMHWARKQSLRSDEQPLPFTGTVTRRGVGQWRLATTSWPEACDLRWI